MRWAKKTHVKVFRLAFSTGRSSPKCQLFGLDPTIGKSVKTSRAEKPIFRLCKKARFGFQSKKAVFD